MYHFSSDPTVLNTPIRPAREVVLGWPVAHINCALTLGAVAVGCTECDYAGRIGQDIGYMDPGEICLKCHGNGIIPVVAVMVT